MVTAKLIAGTLIEKNGKFLLVNAKVGTPKGLWNLPGGHVEDGETFYDAAKRETKEETGFDVDVGKIFCIAHQNITGDTVIVTFEAKIRSGSLSIPDDEISEAKWFTFEEIENMSREKITHTALNSVLAFKKNKQMIYSSNKLTL